MVPVTRPFHSCLPDPVTIALHSPLPVAHWTYRNLCPLGFPVTCPDPFWNIPWECQIIPGFSVGLNFTSPAGFRHLSQGLGGLHAPTMSVFYTRVTNPEMRHGPLLAPAPLHTFWGSPFFGAGVRQGGRREGTRNVCCCVSGLISHYSTGLH